MLSVNASYAIPVVTLSTDALAAIFLGVITWWDDPVLTALNAGVPLPHTRITVVVPSVPSDSTVVFTAGLQRLSATYGSRFPTGGSPLDTWPTTTSFLRASSDATVAELVSAPERNIIWSTTQILQWCGAPQTMLFAVPQAHCAVEHAGSCDRSAASFSR